MLPFFRKKQLEEDKLYPGFNTRLFAALLDSVVALIVLAPIAAIIVNIMFDIPPSKELSMIMQHSIGDSDGVRSMGNNLNNSEEYQEFMRSKGYSALFLEQSIQFVLMGIAIILFWVKTRATPGKMLFSMKIVDAKTLGEPTVTQLIVRLLSYSLTLISLGLGVIYMLFNKKRRALHDVISDTVVVYKRNLPVSLQNS